MILSRVDKEEEEEEREEEKEVIKAVEEEELKPHTSCVPNRRKRHGESTVCNRYCSSLQRVKEVDFWGGFRRGGGGVR